MYLFNNGTEETSNDIWQMIVNFFNMVSENINNFIRDLWSIDEFIIGLYAEHIQPLDEVIKFFLLILTVVILVLGTISLIKKSIKFVIIVAVVIAIFVFLNQL